jgi:Xaa-Pro aminopeptidase
MGEKQSTQGNKNRAAPISDAFREFIQTGWSTYPSSSPEPVPMAAHAAIRRDQLSARFPGVPLIVPAGIPKQRSNDTDYPFRPHSAFSYFTGWGHNATPGSILMATPHGAGHQWQLLVRGPAPRTSDEFYANASIGEFWTGRRPDLAAVSAWLGIETLEREGFRFSPLEEKTALLREADPAFTIECDALRGSAEVPEQDALLERVSSEMRLVKDSLEISELRAAIASTHSGFSDIIECLPRAVGHPRGERIVEGAFTARARLEGNTVGYDSIVASGSHACILHWVTNDGPITQGDLLLVDAGVERESLYTADITRTLPVSGSFTPQQKKVYEAVLEAADTAFAAVKPGVAFHTIHDTAMAVIAKHVSAWGFLPVSLEETLEKTSQLHRRYMIHGTSHHLGLDVHDCAHARKEKYLEGTLEEGMVFTIEPGLYFQPDDETVPPEWRGIGVRIEDNILVTATGAENLSAAIPRSVSDVEAWMAR